MATIIGFDNGRSKVAAATVLGIHQFSSKVSEGFEMKNPQYLDGDMEIEWNGQWYFVGDLADREGRYSRSNYGKTKASEVTLLQLFAACWLNRVEGDVNLSMVVPIDDYIPEERKKIRELLKGTHTFNIRGVRIRKQVPKLETWTINVLQVLISQECETGYWVDPLNESTQTLDFGAKTVNYSFHNKDRIPINDFSGTMSDTGWEVIKEKEGLLEYDDDELDPVEVDKITSALSKRVCDHVLKIGFKTRYKTQVMGGVAGKVIDEIKQIFPNAYIIPQPRQANAIGALRRGREVFNR